MGLWLGLLSQSRKVCRKSFSDHGLRFPPINAAHEVQNLHVDK
jgi:hypothetical protein